MLIIIAVVAILTAVYFYNKYSSIKARKSRWEGWYIWSSKDSDGNITAEGYGIRRGGENICEVTMPRAEWPREVQEFADWMMKLPKADNSSNEPIDAIVEEIK